MWTIQYNWVVTNPASQVFHEEEIQLKHLFDLKYTQNAYRKEKLHVNITFYFFIGQHDRAPLNLCLFNLSQNFVWHNSHNAPWLTTEDSSLHLKQVWTHNLFCSFYQLYMFCVWSKTRSVRHLNCGFKEEKEPRDMTFKRHSWESLRWGLVLVLAVTQANRSELNL